MNERFALTIQHDNEWKEIVRLSAKAGFKYCNFGFGSSKLFHEDGWEKEIENIRETLDMNNMTCVMTHTPYYDLRISSEIHDEALDRAQIRYIEATKMLGADMTAFHPRSHFYDGMKVDTDASLRDNLEDIKRFAEAGAKHGVRIGVENLPQFPGWDVPFYSCVPDDHIAMIDTMNCDTVCGVWDFGHAHLMSIYEQPDAIRKLGSRIKGTHIHGNCKDWDAHYPPSFGTIDWNAVIGALKDTGYDGYLTMEQDSGGPKFGYKEMLPHLYACGAALERIFDAK